MKLIFEKSFPGRIGFSLPDDVFDEIELKELIPTNYLELEKKQLTEVSEIDVIRHYTRLSKFNYGVDDGLYPLDHVPWNTSALTKNGEPSLILLCSSPIPYFDPQFRITVST